MVLLPESNLVKESQVGAKVCAQVVPDSDAFLIIPAHSSARRRRERLFRQQVFTRTSTYSGLGLKILCTAPLQACRQDPGAGPGETQSDSHFPKEFPDSFPRNSHPMSSLERRAQR